MDSVLLTSFYGKFDEYIKLSKYAEAVEIISEFIRGYGHLSEREGVVFRIFRLYNSGYIDSEYISGLKAYEVLKKEFFEGLGNLGSGDVKSSFRYLNLLSKEIVLRAIINIEFDISGVGRAGADISSPKKVSSGIITSNMEWLLRQISAGRPIIINPLTGREANNPVCIHPFMVLLRDEEGKRIFCTTFHPLADPEDGCALYLLPSEKLILAPHSSVLDQRINKLVVTLMDVFRNFLKIDEYVTKTTTVSGLCICELPERHLGHYVWNVISGWSTLLEHGLPDRVRYVAIWDGGHFFGEPEEIYPELTGSGRRIVKLKHVDDAINLITTENLFFLPLHDKYIRKDFCDRVVERSRSVSSEFISVLRKNREIYSYLVLITIRSSFRQWINQVEGYALIINELMRRFPSIAFYIDGVTSENLDQSTHRFADLEKEHAMAEAIKLRCAEVDRVVNAIGISMLESVALCDVIDVFIAPAGSGMTKYKWITNKKGVAHTNYACLTHGQGGVSPMRVWDYYRDGVEPAVYVAVEDIRTIGDVNSMNSNYDVDVNAILNLVSPLIEKIYPKVE